MWKKFAVALGCYLSLSCFSMPTLTAKSWIVSQGTVSFGIKTKEIRPIASITKLMTVMVYIDAYNELGLKADRDLIQRAIVYSDNKAAEKLCDTFPGGKYDCRIMMNLKSQELGLENTNFFEPTGLSVFNYSTAEDLVKIVEEASKYEEITFASHTKKRNTNPTIGKYNYTVSKTGYIHVAGGCIVAKVNDRIVVILGSKNVRTRISELETLLRI